MTDLILGDQASSMLRDVFGRARSIGLLGPGPVEDHITHAARFFRAAGEPPTSVIDLGSGAGVPGLVLALAWPQSRIVLLDGMTKRTAFLRSAVEELDVAARVGVVEGRAEDLARSSALRGTFEVVTARGFGPPAVTAECATGFLAVGGRLLVSEPPDQRERWPSEGLEILGMERAHTDEPFMALIRQVHAAPDRYPRRVGVPERRPLF